LVNFQQRINLWEEYKMQNRYPSYPLVPNNDWGTVLTANTAKDGTGTQVTVFTANATNGSRVDRMKIRRSGTNVATVLRVFINNGATNATPANNTLYTELTVPACTVSEVAAQDDLEIALDMALDPGFKINVTVGTTIAAALHVTVEGGDF
jgi:hypothetical protein